MNKQFKYKSVFDRCFIATATHTESQKLISQASLDQLKDIGVPETVNLSQNIDLIATVFNAAVINQCNGNDDALSTASALACKSMFLHKPTDLEHDRSQIVGHIIRAGWSSCEETPKLLTDEVVANMSDPFNLVLAAVVYRIANEAFCKEIIEATNPASSKYMYISTSWELGFDDYNIVLGSRNLKDAEIISSEKQKEEFSQYLRCNNGTGQTKDGVFCGREIIGDVLPFGIGYTTKPAARVKGVEIIGPQILSEEDNDKTEEIEDENDAKKCKNKNSNKAEIIEIVRTELENFKKENNQAKESISQNQKIDVINSNNNLTVNQMEKQINTVDELLACLPAEVSKASVTAFIAKQIEEKSKVFEKQLQEREDVVESLQASQSRLVEMEKKISAMEGEAKAKEQESLFQTRMTALSSEFELSGKDSEIIAKKIHIMSNDDYNAWYGEFSVLAESKNKASIAAKQKTEAETLKNAIEAKIAELSKATQAQPAAVKPAETPAAIPVVIPVKTEEALASAKETPGQVLPNAADNSESEEAKLFRELKEEFRGSVVIK